jgi:hypothetical protein
MLWDLDKIDSARYDKWKKTVHLQILDSLREDLTDDQYKEMLQKKVEAYVNYVLSEGPAREFSLKPGKKYHYVIEIVRDHEIKSDMVSFLDTVNKQVIELTQAKVNLSY